MANKAIKEYEDFAGTNGYVIVDGLDEQTPGGKLKVPNYSGVTDGYVLTKTTTNGSDDVVWSAPAGGGIDFSNIGSWENSDGITLTELNSADDNEHDVSVVFKPTSVVGGVIKSYKLKWKMPYGTCSFYSTPFDSGSL